MTQYSNTDYSALNGWQFHRPPAAAPRRWGKLQFIENRADAGIQDITGTRHAAILLIRLLLDAVRIILQRVHRAHVTVDQQIVGKIGAGLVALVAVTHTDTENDAIALATKTLSLRLFDGPERAFDRNIATSGGGVLCISQFTLFADVRRGNRPSWTHAAPPSQAEPLIRRYIERLSAGGVTVEQGRFGAHMDVTLTNDGPVTVILDSQEPGLSLLPGTAAAPAT